MKNRRLLPTIFFAGCLAACSSGSEPDRGSPLEAEGTQGMVSSAHPVATEAGLETLRRGGNAFDAAVVIASTLNVVEPMMSGLGGYGTILVYDAERGEAHYLDASGKIPAGVDPDAYRSPTPGYEESRRNAKAVSTPGAANAWQAMSRRFGTLPWPELLEPAIRVAEEGFVVDERTARFIAMAFDEFPAHAREFYGKNGHPLTTGDRLVQTDLASSLRLLAEEGAATVHGGALGEAIDAAMIEAGGFLRLSDLTNDRAESPAPLIVTPAPPPASTLEELH